ncbi:MAG: GNAT family N-acetyltransferase [Saprospiraceae bacterium]|nr:GNAT family N-acetyltransferase [Saprospiraceae bacterium]
MHTNHSDLYRSFAAEVSDLPLFMQPWYLDVVCRGGSWDAVTVQKGGKTVAALPYFLKQKFGWRYITMPQVCKQMGPYLHPEYRSLKWEMRLYEDLIAQFPPGLAAFEQNFNYLVTNWLPFFWQDFRQTTMYSYVLSLTDSEDLIFKNIEKNYRQKIRAAEAKLLISHDLPLTELHRLIGLSFERQGLDQPLDFSFLECLYTALYEQGCGKLFFATDPSTGALHSAALLAWDNTSAYYLMSGDDPALRASGAAVLLKWEAIQYAKNVVGVPVFDFEGSMIRGVEQGRRDFGAQQRPYFQVLREWSTLWKWGKFLKRQ